MTLQYCPCGTGKEYFACCGIFLSEQKNPATPEELMRSRYTAYTQVDVDYLAKTMKSPSADHFDPETTKISAKKIKWVKLKVIKTSQNEAKGMVEFKAYYFIDGKKYVLHEVSEFHFEDGKWYYTDGILKHHI